MDLPAGLLAGLRERLQQPLPIESALISLAELLAVKGLKRGTADGVPKLRVMSVEH